MQAVSNVIKARVVPAAVELIDGDSLEAVAKYLNVRSLAPAGTGALLLLEVDGLAEAVAEEAARCEQACRDAGATEILRARDEAERQEIWRVRRELSLALKTITPIKFNHDVVVPKGRIPQLFEFVERLKKDYRLRIPCFGHAGDGNIHVNIMVHAGRRGRDAPRARGRAGAVRGRRGARRLDQRRARHRLREGQVPAARTRSADDRDHEARQARLRSQGILNPGKIFPES